MKLYKTLPAHALGEILKEMMGEGETWQFTFRKNNGFVNIMKFDVGDESKCECEK